MTDRDRLGTVSAFFRERPRLRTLAIAGPPSAILVVFFALPLVALLVVSFHPGQIVRAWTL